MLLGAAERPWGPDSSNPAGPARPQGQTVPSFVETGTTIGQDTDGVVISRALLMVYIPTTPLPAGGIGSYVASATYNGTLINMLDVRPGLFPFDAALTSKNINNVTGVTTFSGAQNLVDAHPPLTAAKMVPRLMGCKTDAPTLTLHFTSIVTRQSVTIPEQTTASTTKTFRRGDAKADGVVNAADTLFIAQYIAGNRQVGDGTGLVHPINAASVKQDVGGDKITVADALLIAQMIVGIRNSCYLLP